MSDRQAETAERNRKSFARLSEALPAIFPPAVLARALDRPVDHRVPLFRVWSEHRDVPWPKLLEFWGLPNLQVVNRDAHATKSALEAQDRRVARSLETAQANRKAAVGGD